MSDINLTDKATSYGFEHVAAKLVPFDLDELALKAAPGGITSAQLRNNFDNRNNFVNSPLWTGGTGKSKRTSVRVTSVASQNLLGQARDKGHPLGPIVETLGLVFPYNPTISEKISIKYDAIDLTHTNENYYSYKGTENVRINISGAKWTCDTFENAVYALAAMHFFRSYQHMDFGAPRGSPTRPTGRPPAPMWFSAYGQYGFNRVPCLLESADFTFPNDIDYIGIPEPGTEEWTQRKIMTVKRPDQDQYTWMPIIFEVSSINLIVQHSPLFWINWNLEDFRSGNMLKRNGGFHRMPRSGIVF